ncbi:MAG: hypothetical protein M9927_04070 [Anaerolineae bacterium]|nr:hypothetical protein [Anaerolineae bacterium]
MAHTQVRMRVSAVKKIAKKCNQVADAYGIIIALITIAIIALQSTNFISFGANTAAIAVLAVIKGVFSQEKEKLHELSRDVEKAVQYYLTEDASAAGRFSYR